MADLNNLNNTADHTSEFDPQDIEQNKVMGILAYLGILVLVPILAAKDSKFARYHANQGLVLCIAEIVVSIIGSILANIPVIGWILSLLCWLINIALFILAIIGIVNAVNGRAKDLPIIGNIRILK